MGGRKTLVIETPGVLKLNYLEHGLSRDRFTLYWIIMLGNLLLVISVGRTVLCYFITPGLYIIYENRTTVDV